MSPFMMRLVMAHCRSVCVDGLALLWCLEGASSISSKLMAGCRVVLPVFRRLAAGSVAGACSAAATSQVVALSRLIGFALVVLLVVLLPAAFADWRRRGNRLCFAGFIQRHLDLHGGDGVGVLVRRHHERGHGGRLGA